MISVFLDNTGSMQEMAKKEALIYTAKSIEDYCNFYGIQVSFFNISGQNISKIEELKITNQKTFPTIKNSNSIFISDGLIESKDFQFDASIGIGIDADLKKLNEISKFVVKPENLIMAVDYLVCSNKIQLLSKNEQEDEW